MGEILSIGVAFIIFLGLTFKTVKNSLIIAINNKISEIEKSVMEPRHAKNSAYDQLILLKKQYQDTIEETKTLIQNAHEEATMIVSSTDKKMQEIANQSNKLFQNYCTKAEEKIIQEVTVQLLNVMLKNYLPHAKSEQNPSLEIGLDAFKKKWN